MGIRILTSNRKEKQKSKDELGVAGVEYIIKSIQSKSDREKGVKYTLKKWRANLWTLFE